MELLIENGVDVERGLELLGDVDTYNEMLAEFILEIDEKIIQLNQYHEQADLENYTILVHALKSEAKYFGFTKLAEMLYNHEMESKNANNNFVNNNFSQLMTEIKKTAAVVREYGQ